MSVRQTKVGIVAGNFSPFHIGHMSLISQACQENKLGVVYASNKARGKLCSNSLKKVWDNHIAHTLPVNCHVFHLDHSPIKQIYDYFGSAEENRGGEKYVIYTETNDAAKNFAPKSLAKYFPWLIANGNLEVVEVPRESNYSISGTEMRRFLELGDKESFCNFLPNCNKDAVWNTLYNS